jgi:uncharacterized protein (DUF2141 family)
MTRIATIAALIALAAPAAASAAPVRIDLSGLRAGGTLYVQLQTRDQFMGAARTAGRIVEVPQAGNLGLDLGEVPPGEYAITIWHDDNGNHRFDVDPRTGRPADGIAGPQIENLRGPPTFDQAKVAVPAAGLTLPLALHYGR